MTISSFLRLQASVWLAIDVQGFPHREISPIAISSLSFSHWQTEQFWLAFCASESARGIYPHSVHLCIAAVPRCSLISGTQVATSSEYARISICQFQSCSDPRREFFWWASVCPNLMHLLNAHSYLWDCTHTYSSFIGQFSPSGPSIQSHGQAIGHSPWSFKNPNIGPNSVLVSPLSWFVFTFFNESGSIPNRISWIHLGTVSHKPSRSLSVKQESFIGHHPSGRKIQQLLKGSQASPRGKGAPCSWMQWASPCIPCSNTNHFHFVMELSWAWPLPLEHLSNIIQDITGISVFKIMSFNYKGIFNYCLIPV